MADKSFKSILLRAVLLGAGLGVAAFLLIAVTQPTNLAEADQLRSLPAFCLIVVDLFTLAGVVFFGPVGWLLARSIRWLVDADPARRARMAVR